jgi:hypothetical protein
LIPTFDIQGVGQPVVKSFAATAKLTRCGGAKFSYIKWRNGIEVRTVTSLPPTKHQINCAKHEAGNTKTLSLTCLTHTTKTTTVFILSCFSKFILVVGVNYSIL